MTEVFVLDDIEYLVDSLDSSDRQRLRDLDFLEQERDDLIKKIRLNDLGLQTLVAQLVQNQNNFKRK